jgi:hypothetical protein
MHTDHAANIKIPLDFLSGDELEKVKNQAACSNACFVRFALWEESVRWQMKKLLTILKK